MNEGNDTDKLPGAYLHLIAALDVNSGLCSNQKQSDLRLFGAILGQSIHTLGVYYSSTDLDYRRSMR